MLEYKELIEIIERENIDSEQYSLPYLRSLYGNSAHKSGLLIIIQTMILVTLDEESHLCEVLDIVEEYERNNNIETYSHAIDLLDVVISNLEINSENALRLVALTSEADVLSAYNSLMSLFSSHITKEILDNITAQRLLVFDPALLI